VPWSNILLAGFYRLLPGVFNWGMMKMMRRLDSKKEN
jgi:hypothetical protein